LGLMGLGVKPALSLTTSFTPSRFAHSVTQPVPLPQLNPQYAVAVGRIVNPSPNALALTYSASPSSVSITSSEATNTPISSPSSSSLMPYHATPDSPFLALTPTARSTVTELPPYSAERSPQVWRARLETVRRVYLPRH